MRNGATRSLVVLALALLGLSGLGCAYQHVRPTEEGANPGLPKSEHSYPRDGFQDPRRPSVFRVFFDGAGTLCPDPALVRIDDRGLAAADSRFEAYFATRGGYDPEETAADFGRRISAFLAPGKPLVIFIHGIDNSYCEARRAYDLARRVVRDEVPGLEAAYLEVYWDALHGGPLAIWSKARESSKWVGLGLRRLLGKIDPRIPLRLISHSRGASVISAALWNVPLGEDRAANERFQETERSIPTPSPASIRIGLLGPAMPEGDFESFFDRTPGCPGRTLDQQVILGVNEDDPALSKGILGPDIGSSTAAGCRAERFYRTIAPALNQKGEVASMIDLSGSEIHDFKDYLLRRAFLEEFLPKVFERELAPGVAAAVPSTR